MLLIKMSGRIVFLILVFVLPMDLIPNRAKANQKLIPQKVQLKHKQRTKPVLELIKKIIVLNLNVKTNIEKLLNIELALATNSSNEYYDTYRGLGSSSGVTSIEVRLPKSRGGTIVIIELNPKLVTTEEVLSKFGTPKESLQPHIIPDKPNDGEMLMKHQVNDKTITWVFMNDKSLKSVVITDGR